MGGVRAILEVRMISRLSKMLETFKRTFKLPSQRVRRLPPSSPNLKLDGGMAHSSTSNETRPTAIT